MGGGVRELLVDDGLASRILGGGLGGVLRFGVRGGDEIEEELPGDEV
jgi:hypothetical protein